MEEEARAAELNLEGACSYIRYVILQHSMDMMPLTEGREVPQLPPEVGMVVSPAKGAFQEEGMGEEQEVHQVALSSTKAVAWLREVEVQG